MIFKGIFEKTMPVTGDWILRANLKKRRFARNGDLHFTGKSQKAPFCP